MFGYGFWVRLGLRMDRLDFLSEFLRRNGEVFSTEGVPGSLEAKDRIFLIGVVSLEFPFLRANRAP